MLNPESGDPSDRLTASIQTLFRLGGSRRIHQQQTAAAGISVSQQALRVLERTIQVPGSTPGQLATILDLDPAVVTRLLRQLEDAGYVERRRSPLDGRVSAMEPTESGLSAFEQVRQVIWGQVRRALADWPDSDVATLADLLDRLVHDVQVVPYRAVVEELAPRGP